MEADLKEIRRVFDTESKTGFRFLTAVTIVYLIYLFLLSFVSPIYFVSAAVSAINLKEHLFYIPLTAIVYVLSTIVFTNDILYDSDPKRNIYARAFQQNLPTHTLKDSLGVDMARAKNLWFSEFNKWGISNHARHNEFLKTFQRGYACRFIYALVRYSSILWLVGSLFLIGEMALILRGVEIATPETFWSRWLFIIGVTLLNVYLRGTHRVGHKVTGVWARFKEINDSHSDWVLANLDCFREQLRHASVVAEPHSVGPQTHPVVGNS